jgi:hypothetical protein
MALGLPLNQLTVMQHNSTLGKIQPSQILANLVGPKSFPSLTRILLDVILAISASTFIELLLCKQLQE